MSIEIVKLINGETLLTEVTFEDETHLHIIDPVQITVHTRKDASPICICTIWVPLTKEVNLFHIKQSAIMLKSEVDEDMITYYNRCLETINDSMESDSSASFFSSDDEEQMTDRQIQEVYAKVVAQSESTANTTMH
ncbi:hypothetical protein N9F71_00890 [bacterium]|jgi:hypothetical protein|nr:hypothetical protein [bacterium]MDB4435675.1 hypothetical protein [bacterium]|tara:strand:- start:1261 stop:1668 length:408 start_codon:yes stop_codon:yes gene_type:complete